MISIMGSDCLMVSEFLGGGGGDKKVLEMGGGGGYTTLGMY